MSSIWITEEGNHNGIYLNCTPKTSSFNKSIILSWDKENHQGYITENLHPNNFLSVKIKDRNISHGVWIDFILSL